MADSRVDARMRQVVTRVRTRLGPARARIGRARQQLEGWRPPRRTALRFVHLEDDGRYLFGKAAHRRGAHPPDRVVVGRDVRFGDHVELQLGPRGRIELGDDVVVGPHVLIVADALVRVGAGARLGSYSVLVDTWTYGRAPAGPVPTPAPAPVEVGAGAHLGSRTVVGPGVRLAPGATTRPGALVHLEVDA